MPRITNSKYFHFVSEINYGSYHFVFYYDGYGWTMNMLATLGFNNVQCAVDITDEVFHCGQRYYINNGMLINSMGDVKLPVDLIKYIEKLFKLSIFE